MTRVLPRHRVTRVRIALWLALALLGTAVGFEWAWTFGAITFAAPAVLILLFATDTDDPPDGADETRGRPR